MGSVHGIAVIHVGNDICNLSSNVERGCLNFT